MAKDGVKARGRKGTRRKESVPMGLSGSEGEGKERKEEGRSVFQWGYQGVRAMGEERRQRREGVCSNEVIRE